MLETSLNKRHRRVLWLAGGCALAAVAFLILNRHDALEISHAPVPQVVDGGKLATATDGAEIFQKAFWKRPRPEDKILHAERREWTSEKDGVRKWECFLSIAPGPGLVDDIRQRYSLHPAALQPETYTTAPQWLRTALRQDFTVLASDDASLTLALSPDGQTLLATGRGHGFARAVTPVDQMPEPVQ